MKKRGLYFLKNQELRISFFVVIYGEVCFFTNENEATEIILLYFHQGFYIIE